MLVVTAKQMRELDRLTIEQFGVPSLTLMERAGEAIAGAIVKHFGGNAKKGVLIVAGKGNNGGDGFVVARLLKNKRMNCEVALLARQNELSPDATHNLRAFQKRKGKVFEVAGSNVAPLKQRLSKCGLIVDAIFGTGMKNDVRGLFAEAITLMNASGLPIVAVDIPSGLDTDKGTPLGVAIQAKMTVALGYPKLGEVIYPGLDHVGDLVVADIGIDPRALAEVAPRTELLEPASVGRLVPRRAADSHKGSYGHLLIIAGSRGKTGAAVLSCRAAMRSGAGLVTLAAPRSLNSIFATSLVEVMTEPLRENAREEIEPLSDDEWRTLLERKTALLFGPGIGVNDATQNTLRWLLRNLDMPW
ncbi:MAG: NAD(P)H-hydrate epimerase, partial [Candidatus Binatia bacterium]